MLCKLKFLGMNKNKIKHSYMFSINTGFFHHYLWLAELEPSGTESRQDVYMFAHKWEMILGIGSMAQ